MTSFLATKANWLLEKYRAITANCKLIVRRVARLEERPTQSLVPARWRAGWLPETVVPSATQIEMKSTARRRSSSLPSAARWLPDTEKVSAA